MLSFYQEFEYMRSYCAKGLYFRVREISSETRSTVQKLRSQGKKVLPLGNRLQPCQELTAIRLKIKNQGAEETNWRRKKEALQLTGGITEMRVYKNSLARVLSGQTEQE